LCCKKQNIGDFFYDLLLSAASASSAGSLTTATGSDNILGG
jgi:hypothetical protein